MHLYLESTVEKEKQRFECGGWTNTSLFIYDKSALLTNILKKSAHQLFDS